MYAGSTLPESQVLSCFLAEWQEPQLCCLHVIKSPVCVNYSLVCVRAPVTPGDIGPCYSLLKVHLISCPLASLSSLDPEKLIGSAIIL